MATDNGVMPDITILPKAQFGEAFVVDLTPELARYLLDMRPEYQRKVNEEDVLRYAADMESADWTTSSAAITVTATKTGLEQITVEGDALQITRLKDLVNGQHRCFARGAAKRAKGPIPVILYIKPNRKGAGGIDEQFLTEDTGRNRSWVDFCRNNGVENYVTVSGIVINGLAFDLGGGVLLNAHRKASNAQRWKWLQAADQDLIEEAAAHSDLVFRDSKASRPYIGALFYLAARDGAAEEARDFWMKVAGRADTPHDSPPAKLRALLNKWAMYPEQKPPPNVRNNYVIAAWHQYLAGETNKAIYWRADQGPLPVLPDWFQQQLAEATAETAGV